MTHCHCQSCRRNTGSALATFVGFASEGFTYVYVCTLDRPQDFVPQAHVHTGEQLPWLHLDDGLPRYLTTARDAEPIA